MPANEVYPRPPLVLAALELRHPPAEQLTDEQRRQVKASLTKVLPIMKSAQQMAFEFGPNGQRQTVEEFPKFFNRDSTVAVSMRPTSIVIEASSYEHWDAFKAVAEAAVKARISIGPLDGIERIGLRYINEVRVSEPVSDWAQWVDASLLAPSAPVRAGYSQLQWQGGAVYGDGGELQLVLQFGPRDGFAIGPSELRRVVPVASTGFFLLDVDSFWTPANGTPEFSLTSAMEISDRLHSPVDELFESLITERLREEVLRVAI